MVSPAVEVTNNFAFKILFSILSTNRLLTFQHSLLTRLFNTKRVFQFDKTVGVVISVGAFDVAFSNIASQSKSQFNKGMSV